MTKLIISLFFLLIFLTETNAQVDNVTGQYVDKGNILLSPGAESGLKGWTNSAGTFTVESTGAIVGQRVFKVVLSSQTLNLRQDSTKYATEYADGVQLLAYARVKTSVSGVKLCPRKAEVTQTSLCVSHTGSGKWELLKVPFISSGTSNGLALITDSSKSGTVYVDDTFVGAVDLKVDGQAINSQSSELNRVATFGATNITGALTLSRGQGLYSYNSSTGFYTALKKISVSASIALKQNGATRVLAVISKSGSGVVSLADGDASIGDGWSEASYSGELLPGEQISFSNATGTTTEHKISLSAIEIASTSTYSSTNADTDWQACTFSTLAWQGLGTVTNNLECKRQGSDLLMRGVITTGTVAASIAQVPLPLWNGVQLSSAKSQTAGRLVRGNASANAWKDFNAILTSGFNYFTIGAVEYAAGQSPFASTNGNALFSSSEFVVFENIRIPIQGWENSNVIIGQFNGLESCKDSYECTDVFSAVISNTGFVSNENIDWINGNCSMTSGLWSCPYKSGLNGNGNNLASSMNCVCTASEGLCEIDASSSTLLGGVVRNFSGIGASQEFRLTCQKQGADYIGKTAKAVFQTGSLYSSPTVLSQGANGANTFEVGTYTATNAGTNLGVTSVNFSADSPFKYMRVGNMLFVSGKYVHNITSGFSNNFGYDMTLPSFVTNQFTNVGDCSGTAVGENTGSGAIRSATISASFNRIRVSSGVTDTGGPVVMNFHAMCILR